MKKTIPCIIIFLITVIACCNCNKQDREDDYRETDSVIFSADFSNYSPLSSQFYSWEGREYDNKIYEPLSSIKCEDNTAYLKTFYDDSIGLWRTQMMSTAGLFESDNFTCEFEGKFSGEIGSWQCVITYGTGIYWTDNTYSDGIKWPSGGEIDVFEQSFQQDSETGNDISCFIPAIHYGSGRESGYPERHMVEKEDAFVFSPDEWHHFKFSLYKGILTTWIDDEQICRSDYSNYTVSNNYLSDYYPFLNPQAFYIEAGIDVEKADKNKEYEFCIRNFNIIQQENIKCDTLEIYPQMWGDDHELVYPVGAEIYLERKYNPVNTSNKSCEWSSSDESVATVSEGYVKTLKEGQTVISAQCGDAIAYYKVIVSENANVPIAKIETMNDSLTLKKGQIWDLEYYIYPSFVTENINIETDNDNILSINGNVITGKEVGNTNLYFKSNEITKQITVSVEENTRDPFIEYDLSQVTSLIGTKKGEKGFSENNIAINLGEDEDAMNLSVQYSITDILFEDKWTQGITSAYLESPILSQPKKITEYPTLFILKGTEGKLRTNSQNVNSMPSVDITDKELVVRYGDVSLYQSNNESNIESHIIGIYLNDGKSYLYVDGVKVVDGARTDYIQDLQQLILSSNKTNGLEYFAAYLNVDFSDDELKQMTSEIKQ